MTGEKWESLPRWGETSEPRDPDIVLITAKSHTQGEQPLFTEAYPNLNKRDLLGYQTHNFRIDGSPEFRKKTRGIVCQSARELHSILGCPYRCQYCCLGTLIRVLVNVEEQVQHLDEVLNLEPYQRLYKCDNQTDINCFEAEWVAPSSSFATSLDTPTNTSKSTPGRVTMLNISSTSLTMDG